MEPYHVEATHPQLMKYGDFYAWSKAQGLHGHDGYDARNPAENTIASSTVSRTGKGGDPRVMIGVMQKEFWETVGASTTRTVDEGGHRLVGELPEGASGR